MSGSNMLTLAGIWDDMCGYTMKAMFKSRSKVFMQLDRGKIILNKKGQVIFISKKAPGKRHLHNGKTYPRCKDLSFHGTWWQQCLVELRLRLSVSIQWDICDVKLWWGLWFMLCRNDTQLNYIILCLFNLITSYLFSDMTNQDRDSAAGDY